MAESLTSNERLIEDAERLIADFARKNPKWVDRDGNIQDPWGAHAWLERRRVLTQYAQHSPPAPPAQSSKTVLTAIDAEPELPGDLPSEMWQKIQAMVLAGDSDGIAELLRIVVRETKNGIRARVSAIDLRSAVEPTSAHAMPWVRQLLREAMHVVIDCESAHRQTEARGRYLRALGERLEDAAGETPAEPPNVWQPIKTAPKGGKWVLLWWPDVTDAPFVGYLVGDEWRAATSGDKWPNIPGPTHWMPLPDSPAVTKSACTCPPGWCCEKEGAAASDIRECRQAGETNGGLQ